MIKNFSSPRQLRKISKSEVLLFKGIWKWKLLSYQLAKKLFFPELSYVTFYEKIKRLIHDGYLIERDGSDLEVCVLQLTKKSFLHIKYDLPFLREDRFAAQSVTHDYLATAFQLGEFALFSRQDVEFFTEQEIQCSEDSLLPDWMPSSRDHLPDGLTRIKNQNFDSVLAFEVELNLKPWLRYTKAANYFDGMDSKIDVVFWICDGVGLMTKICDHLLGLRLRRMDIHHFVLLDDFKKQGWDCWTKSGREENQKIRDIYLRRSPLSATQLPRNPTLTEMQELFFSKRKSPLVLGR